MVIRDRDRSKVKVEYRNRSSESLNDLNDESGLLAGLEKLNSGLIRCDKLISCSFVFLFFFFLKDHVPYFIRCICPFVMSMFDSCINVLET